MAQEKVEMKADKKKETRAKVRIDARVDADILDEIEEIVKRTGETKSKVINDLLADKLQKAASSDEELSRLERELETKNKQIESLLKQQENNQELALHESRERQLKLEIEKEQLLTGNDSTVEKEEKRGWFKWFKRT